MTFKKTKSETKNDTKWLATNVRTAITCFDLLGKYNKMSDKANYKTLTEICNYFRVTLKKYGVWLK